MLVRILIGVVVLGAVGAAYHRVNTRPIPLFENETSTRPRGVFHVHTNASPDSPLTLEQVGAAARERGLQFVVVTDHNHQLAAPMEINGVTIISAAELTTPFGHVINLGASDVLPEGERRGMDVLQRAREMSGQPIVAHPADPKRPWEGPLSGATGFEIVNLASAARHRGGPAFLGLIPALTVWQWRPTLAHVQLYTRETAALRRWDGEHDPKVVGLCGVDAHGRIDLAQNLLSWQLVLLDPLTSDTAIAQQVHAAITRGRFYCMAAALGEAPRFEFYGLTAQGRVQMGDEAAMHNVQKLVVEGPRVAGQEASVVLLRNGEELVRTLGDELVYTHPTAGTYRVEIRLQLPEVLLGTRPVPVLYSNRIRITRARGAAPSAPTAGVKR